MATADELRVVVKAEVDKATAEIKQFNSQLNKSGQQATKSAVNMAKLAAGVAAGVAAFRGAVRIVRDLTDAYAVQERAEAKLAAVLRATGEAAGFNQQQLQSMASGLQGVTTFGDEAIINMQSLLLTFKGIQGEAFERTTELALDLSAAFDQDLKSSALQLGKALEDPATGLTALRRIGVSFTEEQKNMIEAMTEAGDVAGAQTIILDTLEGQVGGVARAMADTATGSAEQMKNAFGDLKEVLGGILSDTLRPMRQELTAFFTELTIAADVTQIAKDIRDSFAELNDQFGRWQASDESERVELYEDINAALTSSVQIRDTLLAKESLNVIEREKLRNAESMILDLQYMQETVGDTLTDYLENQAELAAQRAEDEERSAAAQEAQVEAAERQAEIDERYMDVRAQVLRILESEKTEVEKIREQIEYLNANPWGAGGALEADRLAAVEILQQRLAELTEDTEESADFTGALAAGFDRAALSAGDLGSSVGSLAADTEQAVSFAEQYADELARAADVMLQLGADALSGIGSALGGGDFDMSGMARSAVTGLTNAFAPGMGALAGGLYDVFEGAWSRMFGPANENVQAATAEAKDFIVDLEGVYRTEVEIRREYMNELRRGFDEEFEVLRDQWDRNLISTDEFRSGMGTLNEGLDEAEDVAEDRAAADAKADLEEARKEKIDGLKAARDKVQAEWDAMDWWTKLTTSKDEEAKAKIQVFNDRIRSAQDATTLRGIEAAATGADFMTNGPQLLLVGDNPGGREHVQVNPAPGRPMGMTININAPVYGVDDLYAKLEEAGKRMQRRGRVA